MFLQTHNTLFCKLHIIFISQTVQILWQNSGHTWSTLSDSILNSFKTNMKFEMWNFYYKPMPTSADFIFMEKIPKNN